MYISNVCVYDCFTPKASRSAKWTFCSSVKLKRTWRYITSTIYNPFIRLAHAIFVWNKASKYDIRCSDGRCSVFYAGFFIFVYACTNGDKDCGYNKYAISILSKPTITKVKVVMLKSNKHFSTVDIGQILDIVRKTRVWNRSLNVVILRVVFEGLNANER